MENLEELKTEIFNWAAECGQEMVAIEITRMLQSNLVGITRHDDMPVTHFTLTSVDPRYYTLSENSFKARA